MVINGEVDVDGIQLQLGRGRFQYLTFLVLGLIYSRGAWHVFGIIFLAGDPGHMCTLPLVSENRSDILQPSTFADNAHLKSHTRNNLLPAKELFTKPNSSDSGGLHERKSFDPSNTNNISDLQVDFGSSLQYSLQDGGKVEIRRNWTVYICDVRYVNQNGTSIALPDECPYGWTYGSLYDSTILSEWNLVCENNFLVELSITIFMIGSTVGAMVISPLADRFGRKQVMLACLMGQAVIGSSVAFVPSYILFTALRFFVGMLNICIGLSAYVLMTETFAVSQRTTMSIVFQAFWAVGVMTVAGFGYLLRNWRHLELALSLPNLIAIPCYWLLPESLPWLISQKRWKEAQVTIKIIARVNGKIINVRSLLPHNHDIGDLSAEASLLHAEKETTAQNGVQAEFEVGENCSQLNHQHSEMGGQIEQSLTLIGTQKVEVGQLKLTEEESDCRLHQNQNHIPPSNGQIESTLNHIESSRKTEVTVSLTDVTGKSNYCVSKDQYLEVSGEVNVPSSHLRFDPGERDDEVMTEHCVERNDCVQMKKLKIINEDIVDTTNKVGISSDSILDLIRHRKLRLYSCIMFFLFFVNSLSYFGISFSVPVLHGNPFVNLSIMGAVEIPANIVCVAVSLKIGRRHPNALFLFICGISNILALFTPSDIGFLKLVLVMFGKFAITASYSTMYLYCAEIFPTTLRNQAIGIASVFENIGSISAPFLVHTAKAQPHTPLVVFGVLSLVAALLTLLLPETQGRPLPQTVHELITRV